MNELTVERVHEVITLAESAAIESHSAEVTLEEQTSDPTDVGVPFPEGWDRQPRSDRKRLVEYLRGLPEVEMAELVALMWLGRAVDATAADFASFAEKAQREAHPAGYLAGKPLTQYLRNGLRKLSTLLQ